MLHCILRRRGNLYPPSHLADMSAYIDGVHSTMQPFDRSTVQPFDRSTDQHGRPSKILVDNGWIKIGGLESGCQVENQSRPKLDGPELTSGELLYRAPEVVIGGAACKTYASLPLPLPCHTPYKYTLNNI